VSHGTGHQLLKAGSKRRRTKAEVEDAKMEAEARERAIDQAVAKSKGLEGQLIESKNRAKENANAA